jgi:acyl-[acyl-carrier-protein]-phospholipid O-acyltransferase/long-chain-fatty-acid--[acyl-carrier-protein] ligase
VCSSDLKGERLVLFTDRADATVAPLLAHAQTLGAPELAVPRKIMKIAEVPVLGTGKTDYVAIQRMAETEARAA